MQDILNVFQRFLLPATTVKLIDAGIVNADLSLTTAGVKVVQRVVFESFADKISAIADEMITEAKSKAKA